MDKPWFTIDFVLGLMDCGGIFITVIIVDTFNLAALMFIAKTGQVSKAAVYSTLHGTWTVIFGIGRLQ